MIDDRICEYLLRHSGAEELRREFQPLIDQMMRRLAMGTFGDPDRRRIHEQADQTVRPNGY